MSTTDEHTTTDKETVTDEQTVTDRLAERPSMSPEKVRNASPKGMAIRFAAGAMTSVAAGVLTLAFGPRVGGVMLAFPAILIASLTLIQNEEDRGEAREDARGAIAGGVALTLFAVVFTMIVDHVNGAVALAVAGVAWTAVALGLYRLLWWK